MRVIHLFDFGRSSAKSFLDLSQKADEKRAPSTFTMQWRNRRCSSQRLDPSNDIVADDHTNRGLSRAWVGSQNGCQILHRDKSEFVHSSLGPGFDNNEHSYISSAAFTPMQWSICGSDMEIVPLCSHIRRR